MTIFQRLKKSFASQTSRKERLIYFFVNITIGILIFLYFPSIINIQFVENRLNSTIDMLTSYESEKCVKKYIECKRGKTKSCEFFEGKVSDKIVFFDIDDNTYKKWNKQILKEELTPRDKLADLINIAANNGAKVVFLDILLHDKSPDMEIDNKFVDTLESLQNRDTNIIFSLEFHEQSYKIKTIEIDRLYNLIEESNNFHWSIPLIMSSPDGVKRYFSGYKIKEDPNGNQKVFWGTPIIAAVLYNNSYSTLKDKEALILNSSIKDNDLTIDIADNERIYINSENIFSNRIKFSMRPPYFKDNKNMQGNLSLYQRMTADMVLSNSNIIDKTSIKGKLVIIGNSSPHKGDSHITPVGTMKGMYIIGNAINTIIHGDQQIILSQSSIYIFAEFFAIVFISFIFAFKKFFLHEWIHILILFFILALFYHFFEKGESFKMFFIMSIMFVCNKWVYKFIDFLMISVKFKKLLGRKG